MTDEDVQKYKALYLQTARDYVNKIADGVSKLLQGENDTVVDEVYLDAHSLASQSLMMGFTNIGTFSRTVELVLREKQKKTLELSQEFLQISQEGFKKVLDSFVEIEQNRNELDIFPEIIKINEITGVHV